MAKGGRSSDERYLMQYFQGCSASVFYAKVEEERKRQNREDFEDKAGRLAALTVERIADRNRKICRLAIGLQDQRERTFDEDQSADRHAGACAFLVAFMELPEAKQGEILGGWQMRLNLMQREDYSACMGFGNGATIERVLLIRAESEGKVEAFQCHETNLCRAEGVRLRVSEGIPQEDVERALEGMLQAVREQWPAMMRMEPDSSDVVYNEKSGLQVSNKPQELDGNGEKAEEEQTAGSKSYDGLYA